ncbi:Ferredoxin [Aphelenchoides bicaudatus]|nr:Ferredoxin [Aphelenchoides bicaudatus]
MAPRTLTTNSPPIADNADINEFDDSILVFYVNGKRIEDTSIDPRTTLACYLRDYLKLTGTKIGCNEGGCGACVVMLSDMDPANGQIRHYSVNSCLTPVCMVYGKAVTTVEGIGSIVRGRLHPVQERLAIAHGSQCGFCTPGFIMAMYSLLRNKPHPTTADIDEALQGNLCRCTGYRPILEAYYSFATNENGTINAPPKEENGLCALGENCCKNQKSDPNERSEKQKLTEFDKCAPYDSTQEFIFPPELKLHSYHKRSFTMNDKNIVWYSPTSFDQLLRLKRRHPKSRFISGNSELAVELKFRFIELPIAINPKQVPELRECYLDQHETAVLRSVCAMLHYFAGRHVRNTASVAGNIATASPIRCVKIDDHFFVSYRRTTIVSDEVLKGIWIPLSERNQYFRAYKQAQRREDDIAIVTGAFSAKIDPNNNSILQISASFGGMAPVTKLALQTTMGLEKREWNKKLLDDVINRLAKEFELPPGVPGGMAKYRCALTLSFFFKFFVHVCEQLKIPGYTSHGIESRIGEPHLSKFSSTQIYQDVPSNQSAADPVGRPLMHESGIKHTTGEAIYGFDVKVGDCLHMAYVMSNCASGTITNVDTTDALSMDGIKGYIDWQDISGSLVIGHWGKTVFAKDRVNFFGHPIGAIVAIDHETARRAANLVKVDILKETPIVSIDDALEAESFHMGPFLVHSQTKIGDNKEWKPTDWTAYKHVVEGELRVGGQEHFYLETQNCIAIPGEFAQALGVARHKVNVKVKRIGGGFGGKESACGLFAAAASVAAVKYRQPVSFMLERFDDMAISGTRHPFYFVYKLAVDKDGKFLDINVHCYNNAGCLIELSKGVLERCLVHLDNVYRFGNADFTGRMCKTNCASNTAFRGFGGPQGMMATETIVQHAAEELGFDIDKIREQNLYTEGDCTPFGMHLHQCNIKRCWDECIQMSNYVERKKVVEEFNSKNKYRKRGIHLTPTKFGIGFGFKQLNQAGALVHIYTDGSVLVSHAGMEMGQGLHTKMVQIAARCLGIEKKLVHIQETSTDKVPNTSPTAASVGSDLNGLAIQDACEKLNARLKPFKDANPDGKWNDWVLKAYQERVSLSQTGFGIIHHDPVDFMDGKGAELFGYCVYGVACSEVEVDCLTGDHHVLTVNIVMDVGDSLNPAIDIGQIEGAFIQGYGMFTMEELRVRPDGTRLTRGPGNYKIPSADDAPRHFNVKLLKGSSNRRGIFSSKAIGEPPLFLGSSIFFAIRNAVRDYRLENGHKGYFRMDSPASPENIRLACKDELLEKIADPPAKNKYTPWVVPL